jgi:hypothetical protein
MDLDHYETLGVPPHASTNEIKRAFRALALQHHPDKVLQLQMQSQQMQQLQSQAQDVDIDVDVDVDSTNNNNNSDKDDYGGCLVPLQFHDIQQAYQVLRHTDERREYDEQLALTQSKPSYVSTTGTSSILSKQAAMQVVKLSELQVEMVDVEVDVTMDDHHHDHDHEHGSTVNVNTPIMTTSTTASTQTPTTTQTELCKLYIYNCRCGGTIELFEDELPVGVGIVMEEQEGGGDKDNNNNNDTTDNTDTWAKLPHSRQDTACGYSCSNCSLSISILP